MQESETECALDLKGQFACRPSCSRSVRKPLARFLRWPAIWPGASVAGDPTRPARV
eukprot:COSAG05_NODE_300_length_11883_cov_12.913357_8_plen_56_part_00